MGAGLKIPVFGVIKRGDKVFTKIVKNCSRNELIPIIKGQVLERVSMGMEHESGR